MFHTTSHTVFLLLGSNQGDSLQLLEVAKDRLTDALGAIDATSACYQTAAWGKSDQPDFINQVISVSTSLKPEQILHKILNIERNLGRVRVEKWGSRIIDIDILFYDSEIISQPDLTIPHPAISQRRFTLEPLAEIAPHFLHPVLNKTIKTLLAECKDPLMVKKL